MSSTSHKHTNRLAKEKSPYLLQHAHNPVDWFPWSEEAFAIARKDDKPIFLSVGYSTCHWCHVMEEESFENEAIAQLMNKEFVSIKVDREERPDIDRCYMTYVQASTGSGGWPMSVWLTPTLKPILGATYFPPTDNYGRPGFGTICRRVADLWRTQRDSMEAQATHTTNMLKQLQAGDGDNNDSDISDLTPEIVTNCYRQIERGYDTKFGGFTPAPKFPRPVIFNVLFRVYAHGHQIGGANKAVSERAREISLYTLERMAEGGIYDHLGGGFHRYSVTVDWHIPHFEKMLYDQGQLAATYVDAYLISANPLFKRVAEGILKYVTTNLTHEAGGFFSAEDADSLVDHNSNEKKEGAFYAWSKREIDAILGGGDGELAKIFCYFYGVKDGGNAPPAGDPHGEFTGKNILIQRHLVEEVADRFKLEASKVNAVLAEARTRLLEVRNKRPRPHLDDKVITAWNGLMITAFVKAYTVFNNPEYLHAAKRAAEFIYRNLYDQKTKTLTRNFREGASNIKGFADDYAFLIQALIDLYEGTFDINWLKWAVDLQHKHDELFYDVKNAGFYSVADNDPNLLMRIKEDHDGAEPSNQSVAVMNLLRLSQIVGAEAGEGKVWRGRAEKTLLALPSLLEAPIVMPYMVCALDMMISPALHAAIVGKPGSEDTTQLLQAIHSVYRPNRVVILADRGEGEAFLNTLGKGTEFLHDADMIKGQATAFICENYACRLPTTNAKAVVDMLRT